VAVAKKYGSATKAKQAIKASASAGGLIQRVQADEPKMVRFLAEPGEWYEAAFHWPEGQKFPSWCGNGKKNCELCRENDTPRKAVLAPALDRESGKVIILQMPPSAADGVLARYDKFGKSVRTCDYEIRREGTGLKTKYIVDYEPESRFNFRKYENQMPDIEAAILEEIEAQGGNADDEPEDEEPRSTKKRRSHTPDPEDYEDEDDLDDEDDDEDEDEFDDEDEEEEEDDDDEEEDARPARRSSTRNPPTKKSPARTTRTTARKKSSSYDEEDEYKPSRRSASRSSDESTPRLKRR
jgi:hypothetical protein